MTNHFHLLIRPRETSISRLIQSLLISHTQRYHKHHRSGGHVWQSRFKSPAIQDDAHLLTVLRYIEANPVRAKLVRDAGKYPWSSYAAHGVGQANDLLDPLAIYQGLAKTADARSGDGMTRYTAPSKSKKRPQSSEASPRGCRTAARNGSRSCRRS